MFALSSYFCKSFEHNHHLEDKNMTRKAISQTSHHSQLDAAPSFNSCPKTFSFVKEKIREAPQAFTLTFPKKQAIVVFSFQNNFSFNVALHTKFCHVYVWTVTDVHTATKDWDYWDKHWREDLTWRRAHGKTAKNIAFYCHLSPQRRK